MSRGSIERLHFLNYCVIRTAELVRDATFLQSLTSLSKPTQISPLPKKSVG